MITFLRGAPRPLVGATAALLVGVLGAISSAAAAPGPIGKWQPAEVFANHPTVAKVRGAGYLTVLTRERAMSRYTPMDRSLAIIDAVGAKNAVKYGVDKALTRALRARKSLGPSGALLNKDIPATTLDGRQAMLLGWVRALSAGKAKQLKRTGTTIRTAGALQLLEMAAAKSPDAQAPQLALAVARAALAPRRGKKACAAYVAVEQAARDPRKAAVVLAVAERAVKSVKKLRKSCKSKQLGKFRRPISLPAPAAPPARKGALTFRPSSRTGDVYRKGVAFTVAAPVF